MGEVEKLKGIAQRALDAAEKTKDSKKREEYKKIAQEAIAKAKAYKEQYAKAAEATSPAMGPYQGVAKPSVLAQFGLPTSAEAGVPTQLVPEMAAPMAAQAAGLDTSFMQGEQSQGDLGSVAQAGGQIGEAVVRNAEISGGISGALAGGAMAGPAGAVVGGMVGTFGGSLAEDAYNEVPPDYKSAVNAALVSGAIDVATLGAAKVAKIVWNAFKSGKAPAQAVADIAAEVKAPSMGSQQSLAQTQETLQRYGQTLTPAEIPNGGGIVSWMDAASREAISAAPMVEARANALEAVVKTELDKLYSGGFGRNLSSEELGQFTYGIINAGKKALNANYGAALDGISKELGSTTIRTAPIKNTLERFLNKYKRPYGSDLNDATVKFIEEQMAALPEGTMKATDLLAFEKRMGGLVNEMGTFGSDVYNGAAAFQLGDMSKEFRKAVNGELFVTAPEAAKLYSAAKNTYAQGLSEILPEINKSAIKQAAETGNFAPIGTLLTQVNNTDKVYGLLGSIRSSYAQLGKDALEDMTVRTADEAIAEIRDGYLSHVFRTASDEGSGIMDLGSLAKMFDDPKKARQLKAVLGEEQAASTKRFMNLIHDVTKKPKSPAGTLVLRSLEASTAVGVGASALTGVGVAPAMATAAAVFGSPPLMQKIARNPKMVNQLIALTNNKKILTVEDMAVAFNDLLANYDMLEEAYKD